ncbi:hypothetical protein CEXT_494071 [Caerostris extrusa]|uniref:Uncharacterized protein n=1 Tax=Caerostris extrusa TaxID=172846 RepID=A0AAV4W0F3_CAEEX|nr:hypothetical protein CEXT_494071 [Caerostris extrusa]
MFLSQYHKSERISSLHTPTLLTCYPFRILEEVLSPPPNFIFPNHSHSMGQNSRKLTIKQQHANNSPPRKIHLQSSLSHNIEIR